jgi:hypothetical protein
MQASSNARTPARSTRRALPTPGKQEELRTEAALHKSWQRDLHIGGVSVIESYPDNRPLRHRVEHPLELGDAHPGLVFAGIEFVAGPTDAMNHDWDRGR